MLLLAQGISERIAERLNVPVSSVELTLAGLNDADMELFLGSYEELANDPDNPNLRAQLESFLALN